MVRCRAQVMYAYVMRPETLPKSYWKFIVKSGPVEEAALEAVRRSIRKLPIDLHAFNAFLKKRGSSALLATAFPKQVRRALYTHAFCPFLACLTHPSWHLRCALAPLHALQHACLQCSVACMQQRLLALQFELVE